MYVLSMGVSVRASPPFCSLAVCGAVSRYCLEIFLGYLIKYLNNFVVFEAICSVRLHRISWVSAGCYFDVFSLK